LIVCRLRRFVAKRLVCAELAPAFEPGNAVRNRHQPGRTPGVSRDSVAALPRCLDRAARAQLAQHKPLKPGARKSIFEQAGVSLEQFVEHL